MQSFDWFLFRWNIDAKCLILKHDNVSNGWSKNISDWLLLIVFNMKHRLNEVQSLLTIYLKSFYILPIEKDFSLRRAWRNDKY